MHYQTKHEAGANNSIVRLLFNFLKIKSDNSWITYVKVYGNFIYLQGKKRDQSVLNDFSDEDTSCGRDSSEPPAKRPTLMPVLKNQSPSGSTSGTPRNDPLDLSVFASGFSKPANSTDFLSSAFNWNALGLPLSVAVPQPLPVSLANAFSPQLLPKTKPPNCETLVNSVFLKSYSFLLF